MAEKKKTKKLTPHLMRDMTFMSQTKETNTECMAKYGQEGLTSEQLIFSLRDSVKL